MPRFEIPEELPSGAFTTQSARDAGVGRARLRSRDLLHPHHGLYVRAAGAGTDVDSRCRMLAPLLGADQAFSHRTAARLWGIPLEPPYSPAEGLHVTTIGSSIAMRHSGVIGWVTGRELPVRTLRGLRVLAPADVWAQLALRSAIDTGAQCSHEWLVAAGDFLVSGARRSSGGRTHPLCTIEDLRAAVARRRRMRGSIALAEALEDIRCPVDSPRETLLRLGLVRAGLPEPIPQLGVQTAAGLRHADLGYPEAKLLLEYQGEEHRVSRRRWLEDLTRVQLFQDAGYTVFLIGAADVDPDIGPLAARVRRALGG